MTFDPDKHLMDLGGNSYLEVNHYIQVRWRRPDKSVAMLDYFHLACWERHKGRLGVQQVIHTTEEIKALPFNEIPAGTYCPVCGEQLEREAAHPAREQEGG